jgi:hypothetical protein
LSARIVALLGLLALAQAVKAQSPIDGEFGLRVTDTGDEIGVGWLTSESGPGHLRVWSGDDVFVDVETPPSGSHYVTFPNPHRDVDVAYGLAGRALFGSELFLSDDPPVESGELTGVDSLYVVGDVHGEYAHLRDLLVNAGLVDRSGMRWAGGTKHVVFVGDLFDRGPDVTPVLWLLYRLEHEARAAGGGSHVVLGNHETMVFTGDLRYTQPRELLVARLHGVSYPEMYDIRRTVLGRWLAKRPSVMRVDGVLLAHGGVPPDVEPRSVAALNDSLRTFMSEDLFYRWADTTMAFTSDSALAAAAAGQYDTIIVMDSTALARRTSMVFDENSVFWYRGYVQSDTLEAALDSALTRFGARVHVVGHTPVPTITSRYEGKLIDVNMEDPAIEMLLLTKDDQGRYQRWRYRLQGPPEPL